ncbi:MAG TPA: BamA/TamA family outer membrane protein [Rhizomicrobium sp.]
MIRFTSCLVLSLAVATIVSTESRGAESLTYSVDLTGSGDIADSIRASSLLVTLNDAGTLAPFALVERARRDGDRIKTVLESYGYYSGAVRIAIAGKDLSDPALIDALAKAPEGQTVAVAIAIDRGPLYRLGRIDLVGPVPTRDRDALHLSTGDPAIAAVVLGAQADLLTTLQEDGYAFARVDPPVAIADDARRVLDLSFDADAGPRATLGTLSFKGLTDVNVDFVRDALTVHSGDLYRPSAIETARQTLAGLGVFSGVSVRSTDAAKPSGTVDLVFDVQERPMHTVAFSASYSTDLGVSGSASWSHRNLFGNAEQLNLSAAVTDIGGTAASGIGYDISAQFIKPRFLGAGQALEANLAAVKQDLDAYSQTAETLGVFLRRKFSDQWSGSAGLTYAHDEVEQENTSRLYRLIALPATASYDGVGLANPLADPTQGYRATLNVTPTAALGATSRFFVILQASGSAYFDLSGGGGSVVALRALAASIQGASNLDVPPDQRLYAGGSGTVRGFRYQSIGPRFADKNPVGATSIDAGTVEFRQRIDEDWGAVVFVDAGQASDTSTPFNGALNIGAGAGVRYYTPIGAIRASIAIPLTQHDNRDSFEIYVGLGQAF